MRALTGVSFGYGDRPVLEDVTLDLVDGAITCVLGPSGCGKSTLLRLLAGLLEPTSGTVQSDRGTSAMVFQDPRLLPWLTVGENLALALDGRPRHERRDAIAAMLARVQLTGTERLMPAQLSGGMAQRVGIARALLREPRLLLMDEPFGALDAITRAELQRVLQALMARGRTTGVFVTHDVDEAIRLARRIVVLRDGRIARIDDDVSPAIRGDILASLERASSSPASSTCASSTSVPSPIASAPRTP